jgi:hypothetical protein
MMHYGYKSMWVNVELVEVPTYFAGGKKVGQFKGRTWINLNDTYVAISARQRLIPPRDNARAILRRRWRSRTPCESGHRHWRPSL